MPASAKQYCIICRWYQSIVFEEEICFCCFSQKHFMKGGILLLSEFKIIVTKSWWRKFPLTSMGSFSIWNFICSWPLFTKLISCMVNVIGSGYVFLINTCKLFGINKLVFFIFKLWFLFIFLSCSLYRFWNRIFNRTNSSSWNNNTNSYTIII